MSGVHDNIFHKSIISRVEKLTNEAFLIAFKRSFPFLPGQVIALALSPDDNPRYYSIASGNDEDEIEILFNIKPEGFLTPRLAQLKTGDPIYHSLPGGCFLAAPQAGVWIAAGTGIAPFRSMLLSGVTPALQMIHGSRTKEELYYHDFFFSIFKENYFPCCSREQIDGIFQGRVTQCIDQRENINPDLLYYLCGSAEMVVDTREILLKKGVPYGNILAEIYF